ncbi:glycosyltransferase [Modestobacter sp. VKM Ac-2984]|uniref:glycosyltransferase n=1 Tax=Modestobacter sp. VKM Ac-2984 TaxID=3004138 RepID=UPI0022AA9050|nr:glycosyltransferase [Modestobacter sp. VKM Ac-2984]MCZ2817361.1 glycosyltransferase [Modestobacter sp. VKM Ac-2984]
MTHDRGSGDRSVSFAADQSRIDVLLAMVSDTWSDAVRRGFYSTADQTIKSIEAAGPIRRLLVADHPRGLKSQVYRRLKGDRPAPASGKIRGVRPACLHSGTPTEIRSLERRYRWYDRQLAIASARHRLHAPVTVTFNLWHAALVERSDPSKTVFYAQDDESAIPSHAPVRQQTLEAYRRIAASGMTVIAVSQTLLDRIAPTGPGIVIPNGVDPDLWLGERRLQVETSTSGKTVFYAGTVDARLDVDAVTALATAGYYVDVAGPVRDERVRASLVGLPRVQLLGPRGRSEIVARAQNAGVCLMAHRSTELTQAMSPLKVFEYLASGTPVVATRLPGSTLDSQRVTWVEPGGDYVTAVQAAMKVERLSDADRSSLVQQLSWRSRHEILIRLLVERSA